VPNISMPTTAFNYARKNGAGECNAAEDAGDDTDCVVKVYCYERDCSCSTCNNPWEIQEAPEVFWVYANHARGEGKGELHGRYCFELPVVIPVSKTGHCVLIRSALIHEEEREAFCIRGIVTHRRRRRTKRTKNGCIAPSSPQME